MSETDAQRRPRRRIKKLPQEVIDQIAAGEVVQKPANALKELIENSLDAGSTSITVTLVSGGFNGIQIKDNGYGIDASDFPLLCERFATSKITEASDIYSVQTFGFRGEALAAMSHLSSVHVISRRSVVPSQQQIEGGRQEAASMSDLATSASFKSGKMISKLNSIPAPVGTSITLSRLFEAYPVRRPSTAAAVRTSLSQCIRIVNSYALIHTGVGFALHTTKNMTGGSRSTKIRLDACTQHSEPTLNSTDRIRAVVGDRKLQVCRASAPPIPAGLDRLAFEDRSANELLAKTKLEVCFSDPNLAAPGQILRNCTVFVCGRLVSWPRGKKTVLESLKSRFPPRTLPSFLLIRLELPEGSVDPNVHPAKERVMLVNEDIISSLVRSVVDDWTPPRCHQTVQSTVQRISVVPTPSSPLALPSPPPASAGSPQPPSRERATMKLRQRQGTDITTKISPLFRTRTTALIEPADKQSDVAAHHSMGEDPSSHMGGKRRGDVAAPARRRRPPSQFALRFGASVELCDHIRVVSTRLGDRLFPPSSSATPTRRTRSSHGEYVGLFLAPADQAWDRPVLLYQEKDRLLALKLSVIMPRCLSASVLRWTGVGGHVRLGDTGVALTDLVASEEEISTLVTFRPFLASCGIGINAKEALEGVLCPLLLTSPTTRSAFLNLLSNCPSAMPRVTELSELLTSVVKSLPVDPTQRETDITATVSCSALRIAWLWSRALLGGIGDTDTAPADGSSDSDVSGDSTRPKMKLELGKFNLHDVGLLIWTLLSEQEGLRGHLSGAVMQLATQKQLIKAFARN